MNNTSENFDEFFEMVGTKVEEKGWYVFFNEEGFVRGIQGPGKNDAVYHHRFIRTYAQGYEFLRAHNRPDLIRGLNKVGFRGNTRERIYK